MLYRFSGSYPIEAAISQPRPLRTPAAQIKQKLFVLGNFVHPPQKVIDGDVQSVLDVTCYPLVVTAHVYHDSIPTPTFQHIFSFIAADTVVWFTLVPALAF